MKRTLEDNKVAEYWKMLLKIGARGCQREVSDNVKHKRSFCFHHLSFQLESESFQAPCLSQHFLDCRHLVKRGQILSLRFSHWRHLLEWAGTLGKGVCGSGWMVGEILARTFWAVRLMSLGVEARSSCPPPPPPPLPFSSTTSPSSPPCCKSASSASLEFLATPSKSSRHELVLARSRGELYPREATSTCLNINCIVDEM